MRVVEIEVTQADLDKALELDELGNAEGYCRGCLVGQALQRSGLHGYEVGPTHLWSSDGGRVILASHDAFRLVSAFDRGDSEGLRRRLPATIRIDFYGGEQ